VNDEPNARNHARPDDEREDLQATPWLQQELEELAARLAADGATWQRRLPDAARVAERIRAIPNEPLPIATAGDDVMFTNTDPTPAPRGPVTAPHARPSAPVQALRNIAAVAAVLALIGTMALVFYAIRSPHGGPPAAQPTATSASGPAALQVTSVTMAVTPDSIAGMACGTNVSVTYTATIHVAPNSGGGTVQFTYTINNGRAASPASITFAPGETTKSYTFTWSGPLPADHTYPEQGGIQVTSPNQVTSPLVVPTGQCTTAAAAAPTCGSNFSGTASQSYEATLTTAYGTVPLPPQSRTVPDDAAGGQRGYDICSAGTATSVATFMEQNLPAYGWTQVSTSGGIETWRTSQGTINWSVADPLNWNINWRVPLG
jgi:hypothetical protein